MTLVIVKVSTKCLRQYEGTPTSYDTLVLGVIGRKSKSAEIRCIVDESKA